MATDPPPNPYESPASNCSPTARVRRHAVVHSRRLALVALVSSVAAFFLSPADPLSNLFHFLAIAAVAGFAYWIGWRD